MELKNSQIYIFTNRKCNQICSEHPWKLKSNAKGQPLLYNVQNTAQIYFKKQIAVIEYQQIKAYLWNVSAGVICLHISKDCQNADLFQFKLQEEDIKANQWQKASAQLKKNIQSHCGADITTKHNTQKGKVQKLGNKIGSLFGSLSRKFKGHDIGGIVSKSQIVQQVKEKATAQLVKNPEEQAAKWQTMKQQAKSLNSKINQKMQPARLAITETASKIGQKFTNSDNIIIKGIREFGLEMKRSLNQGYHVAHTKDINANLPIQKPIQSERGLKSQDP